MVECLDPWNTMSSEIFVALYILHVLAALGASIVSG